MCHDLKSKGMTFFFFKRVERAEGKGKQISQGLSSVSVVWWILLTVCLLRLFFTPMFEI
jgi:hypothetical protein